MREPKRDPWEGLCRSCGQPADNGEDHSVQTRVVRPGHTYGYAGARVNERVEIETRMITPAILQATMSLEEYEGLKAAEKRVKAEAEAKPKGGIVEMAKRAAEAARAEITAAKERRAVRDREQDRQRDPKPVA